MKMRTLVFEPKFLIVAGLFLIGVQSPASVLARAGATSRSCIAVFAGEHQNAKQGVSELRISRRDQRIDSNRAALIRANMFTKDSSTSGPVERRIKVLVSGNRKNAVSTIDPADKKIDFADPSLTMPITYPNDVTKYRINASGLRYIEADRAEDFLRGGIFHVQRSRGFYPDGTEMRGAYHNEAWSWDVVTYQNAKGEWIALGGTMKQPKAGELPTVAKDNPTRSRWWGLVKHVEITPGNYEEQIHWQGPIHDFNRVQRDGWDRHGYGGTLLTKWNPESKIHEPVRLKNGNFLIFYERVTQQKKMPDGRLVPYVTTMFSREMDPTLKNAVGPETLATEIISPVTGTYLEATKRGLPHEDEGYLAEGGNVFASETGEYLKVFSGNDYVRKYGIYLDYLPKGSDPQSTFKTVVDESGELIDFATTTGLREIMRGTWIGRPQLEKAPDGKLWMKFHFVPLESIPKGGPVEGWPTARQFVEYGRITAIAPVKITHDHPRTAESRAGSRPGVQRPLYRIKASLDSLD